MQEKEAKGNKEETSILEPQSIVKKIPKRNIKEVLVPALVIVFVVLFGIGSGWFLSEKIAAPGESVSPSGPAAPGAKAGPKEAGLNDEKAFRDSAEGMLEEGGVNGEGTHHLTRDGGPSQNVYLTSTVIDLAAFKGKKVKVWGETVAAKKAGWLMDVGKIKVLE